MFGSLLYKHLSTSATPVPAQKMLTGILALSSACFFVPGHFRDERVTLWCFCIFELCCGVYYPAMGSLKSKLVEDGSRASIYGILRIPLNVFVVLALSTTKEGKHYSFFTELRPRSDHRFRRSASRYGVHHMQCAFGGSCYCRSQDTNMISLHFPLSIFVNMHGTKTKHNLGNTAQPISLAKSGVIPKIVASRNSDSHSIPTLMNKK
jgi:hypothetical protein